MTEPSSDEVVVRLSSAEALVLFAWLDRTAEADAPAPFDDPAEQIVLWDLLASLETVLVAPVAPGCGELLDAARARIRLARTGDDA